MSTDDLVAPLLRADVDASINNLVEHGHAILVGEALEGVLLVPSCALRVESRGDVVGSDGPVDELVVRLP